MLRIVSQYTHTTGHKQKKKKKMQKIERKYTKSCLPGLGVTLKCWLTPKKWFQPTNSMQSPLSLVEIHNSKDSFVGTVSRTELDDDIRVLCFSLNGSDSLTRQKSDDSFSSLHNIILNVFHVVMSFWYCGDCLS